MHPHSRPGRHTRSLTADSARWHTGTVPVGRSSGNKSPCPRHFHQNSHSRRRSARTQGCTSCFYTGTDFPGIGGHLQGQTTAWPVFENWTICLNSFLSVTASPESKPHQGLNFYHSSFYHILQYFISKIQAKVFQFCKCEQHPYLIFYTVAVNYCNCVNFHTAESRVLVWTVRAVRVAITDDAGVGTVAILTLELANGAISWWAGLRFIWAISAIWLAITLPPYRNTPKDNREHEQVSLIYPLVLHLILFTLFAFFQLFVHMIQFSILSNTVYLNDRHWMSVS